MAREKLSIYLIMYKIVTEIFVKILKITQSNTFVYLILDILDMFDKTYMLEIIEIL